MSLNRLQHIHLQKAKSNGKNDSDLWAIQPFTRRCRIIRDAARLIYFTCMQSSSITFIQAEMDLPNKTNPIVKLQFRIPPPNRLYDSNLKIEDGPHDVVTLICKSTHCVKIPIIVALNDLLTVWCLLHSDARLKLINR